MQFDLLKTKLAIHTHKPLHMYVFHYKCIEKVWTFTYQTIKKNQLPCGELEFEGAR